jgi:hypothetical protein
MTLMCSNEIISNLPFSAPTAKVVAAEKVVRIDGVLVVKLANGRIMTSAKDFHKWAYPISHSTAAREPVVKGLARLGVITDEMAQEHMDEHRRAFEAREIKRDREMAEIYAAKAGLRVVEGDAA